MREAELLLLGLMVAVVGLSVLARVIRVPYPILLVLGGLVLGFVPGMPEVKLPPELVLVVFLPPLLYWSGFFASPRELRADLRTISLLAVGLVLATMGAVAVTAHALDRRAALGGGVRAGGDRLAHRPAGRHGDRPPAGRTPPPGHGGGGREPGQ